MLFARWERKKGKRENDKWWGDAEEKKIFLPVPGIRWLQPLEQICDLRTFNLKQTPFLCNKIEINLKKT